MRPIKLPWGRRARARRALAAARDRDQREQRRAVARILVEARRGSRP